ncbi:hypothetical protein [Streptomyces sp. NBC_00140]|uniref:hypothetical protein n=1 Tax=Streptomyces sp. NBC_00140 TaxID=2975664 RepID=UPI002250EAC0|nr:hypothetical protein [Streptomyces sp. NBC_00140]MCX5336887.1 hypothetical protein [Streptomyces sp. NBC_00140]MCX5338370.1 hypothetical protein [Streptomyces sp. NBC_00140]
MDDVVFMVRAGSRAVCQLQLDLICERMDARPATLPTDAVGSGWVARAVPRMTEARTGDGPGPSAG